MHPAPAFSRLQTVPSAPPNTVGAKPKLWILDSWRDLVLYVGTPLLLIPAFALAQAAKVTVCRMDPDLDVLGRIGGLVRY